MVSTLLKAIMGARGLKQAQLADLLGVSIDRVKSLTSGRVTKFTPAEARALVEKLHVRGDYLATGVPPIFKPEAEEKLDGRIALLRNATELASALNIDQRYEEFARDVMFGLVLRDGPLVTNTINNFVAETRGPPPSKGPTRRKNKTK